MVILRLEIALDAPAPQFFQSYIANSVESRGTNKFKTYASVAKGAHQTSHSSVLKEKTDSEPQNSSGKSLAVQDPGRSHPITGIQQYSSNQESCLEVSAIKTKNDKCRGQRVLTDIQIELITKEVLDNVIMASESPRQNWAEVAEPSTSRAASEGRQSPCGDEENSEDVNSTGGFQVFSRRRGTKSEPDERVTVASSSGISGTGTTQYQGGSRPKSHSPTSKMPTTISFVSGNPTVELTKGILHIYKDSQMTALDKDISRSEMLCMLGVPASYTIHDLISFMAPMGDYVSFMQVLRDAFPNQYLLLVKFKDQVSADEFYSYFNNRPYNSIEPDICHLVYVGKVEIINESEGASLPFLDMTELPNCPVCLERMEESVDGILTILCNHAFHTHCLAQWGDTSCPVCRYCQTPEEVADQRCMNCGSHESLWICLICGNVGCGRYVGLHAYKHFQDTNHTYAMQLGTNRVWDYAGDNYVHRLAQNKSDGKLVQVDEGGNEIQEEKLDSITLEYTYLLTTQLESQRLYFMEQIAEAVKDVEAKHAESTQRWEQEKLEREQAECKLAELTREKQSLEKKYNQLHARTAKVLMELQEERQLNKCLQENQQLWQGKVAALEERLKSSSETRDKPCNLCVYPASHIILTCDSTIVDVSSLVQTSYETLSSIKQAH
ncbi:Brca1-associated protein [Plakobranchus ocellatus]|uniref:Brca1-associated protein n=1 Tax=Plakobranchus ocellatus TaxID=259542 RepID=A0AAV3YBS8_9GAST|nr:Brca1-associated protein [Plakobranchus ocellatus]